MNNNDFLEPVIRVVPSPDKVRQDPYSRKIITINRSTGKVEPVAANWTWNRAPQVHYLVRNAHDPDAVGEYWDLAFDLPGKYNDGQFGVRIHYTARCQPGQEQQLALRLFPATRPEDALNDFIRGAICKEVSDGLTKFVEEFSSVISEIARAVESRAASELGLDLELEIAPYESEQMQPLRIPRTEIPLTFKDARAPLLIGVEAALGLDAGIGMSRYVRRASYSTLPDRFLARVAEYLAAEVTLNDAYAGLSSSAPALSAALSDEFHREGRRIDNVQLYIPAILEETRAVVAIAHTYSVQVLGKADPVQFDAAAELSLEDLAIFLAANLPSLDGVFKSLLVRATQHVLFGAAVNEIVHKLETTKDSIRAAVMEGLQGTGYRLSSLTLMTDLPEDLVRYPLRIAVDGWFNLKNSEVLEGLSVALSARVIEPAQVADALKSGNVRQTVEERVREVVRGIMAGTSRDEFFFSFEQPRGSSRWIQRELEEAIRNCLWDEFRLDAADFAFRRTNSQLAELERELQLGRKKFPLKVIQSLTGEQTDFEVGYRIQSPEDKDWHLFQSLQPTVEHIEILLHDLLRQRLSDEGQLKLVGYSNRHLREMMQNEIAPRVTEEIGVRIEFTHWLRKPTEEEIRASGKKRTVQRQSEDDHISFLTEQWQKLTKKYTERLLIDAPEEELNDLREKIEENRRAFREAVQALNGSSPAQSRAAKQA